MEELCRSSRVVKEDESGVYIILTSLPGGGNSRSEHILFSDKCSLLSSTLFLLFQVSPNLPMMVQFGQD
jgi:hypothetical protein